jgi:alpha-L-arabinofuranosidase
MITLQAADPEAENTRDEPNRVAPRKAKFAKSPTTFEHEVPAHSLQMLRLSAAQD